MTLTTIEAIKEAASDAGSHFFSRSNMRFFNCHASSIVHPVDGGAYFVTSDCREPRSWVDPRGVRQPPTPRRYSLRFCTNGGDLHTVGEFMRFDRGDQAHREARRLVALVDVPSDALFPVPPGPTGAWGPISWLRWWRMWGHDYADTDGGDIHTVGDCGGSD